MTTEDGPTTETVRSALAEVYEDVEAIGSDNRTFAARLDGRPVVLRLHAVATDPSADIPAYLDGPGRARHPALAETVGLRCLAELSRLVHVQAEPKDVSVAPIAAGTDGRLAFALEVASAIAYVHEQGWVHGGLRRSAIDTRPVRIYDLGIARLLGQSRAITDDIDDFFALLEGLTPTGDSREPLRRWLDDPMTHGLRHGHASMRAVEDALAALLDATVTSGPRPRVPTSRIEPGTWVNHFHVLQRIGQGGLADVFVARDTVLGRSVALKVLRREAVQGPQTAELLEEARATAAFAHPNIVVLYGVGRFGDRAYLTLEYLGGPTLAELIHAPMPEAEVVRIGLGIARALQEAHARGLLHCDLKPANVLIPEDGRPRVVDFGLARAVQATQTVGQKSWSGTPPYMSPEQWRGGVLTPAVDVWALGLVLYEMLEGQLPDTNRRRAEVKTTLDRPSDGDEGRIPFALQTDTPLHLPRTDAPLAALIRACLRHEPAERPASAEVAATLETLYLATTPTAEPEATPFRGLAAFDEQHARFFFGRDEEAERFVQLTMHRPYMSLVGPSGAGKSSFVRAAVIPRLRQRDRWLSMTVRPGLRPMRALAAALLESETRSSRVNHETASELATRLTERPNLLNLRLHDRGEQSDARVLLFIDQAEELITNASAEQTRAFVEAISSAADDGDDRVRVVIALRDDFVGRWADLAHCTPLLDEIFVLRRPSPDVLARCVDGPLKAVGYKTDADDLSTKMARDVGTTATPLPLLQFTCAALWTERNVVTRTISEADYEAVGGVQGALAKHADQVLSSMPPAEIDDAKAILLRLVTTESTRRVVEEAVLLEGLSHGTSALQRLVDGRLIVSSRRAGDMVDIPYCELVHEALIESWAQLTRWLDETKEERALIDELEDTVRPWIRRGAPAEEAWTGAALQRGLDRIEALRIVPPPTIARFLSVGQQRERARQKRRRGLVVVAFLVTASIAVTSTFTALRLKRQSDQINRGARNLGRFTLQLQPFDIDPSTGSTVAVPARDLPKLDWRLRDVAPGNVYSPGKPFDERFIQRGRMTQTASAALSFQVEVRGGPAFIEVTGRGRAGARCAPTLIRLQRLPGYAERDRSTTVALGIPTCRASAAHMVPIPAGPFISGGPGDPPTSFTEYVEQERQVDLPAFELDKYEVSNRAFRHFAAMEPLTGTGMPTYPNAAGAFELIAEPNHPAVQVAFRDAVAFCRFHGKRLPTSQEWEKGARGGLFLAEGKPNPHPRRSRPWGAPQKVPPANLKDNEDGCAGTCPVDAFPAGASPYGLLNMCGNADEWTSTRSSYGQKARIVRGANWDSPLEFEHWLLAYDNSRFVASTDFRVGFRCARDPTEPPSGLAQGPTSLDALEDNGHTP